jgi:hypothetical protein
MKATSKAVEVSTPDLSNWPSKPTAALTVTVDLRNEKVHTGRSALRIFGLQPDGHATPEPLVVSIDMDKLILF